MLLLLQHWISSPERLKVSSKWLWFNPMIHMRLSLCGDFKCNVCACVGNKQLIQSVESLIMQSYDSVHGVWQYTATWLSSSSYWFTWGVNDTWEQLGLLKSTKQKMHCLSHPSKLHGRFYGNKSQVNIVHQCGQTTGTVNAKLNGLTYSRDELQCC